MISAASSPAKWRTRSVLPTAVGPTIATSSGLGSVFINPITNQNKNTKHQLYKRTKGEKDEYRNNNNPCPAQQGEMKG
jgi:hypothetical protein